MSIHRPIHAGRLPPASDSLHFNHHDHDLCRGFRPDNLRIGGVGWSCPLCRQECQTLKPTWQKSIGLLERLETRDSVEGATMACSNLEGHAAHGRFWLQPTVTYPTLACAAGSLDSRPHSILRFVLVLIAIQRPLAEMKSVGTPNLPAP